MSDVSGFFVPIELSPKGFEAVTEKLTAIKSKLEEVSKVAKGIKIEGVSGVGASRSVINNYVQHFHNTSSPALSSRQAHINAFRGGKRYSSGSINTEEGSSVSENDEQNPTGAQKRQTNSVHQATRSLLKFIAAIGAVIGIINKIGKATNAETNSTLSGAAVGLSAIQTYRMQAVGRKIMGDPNALMGGFGTLAKLSTDPGYAGTLDRDLVTHLYTGLGFNYGDLMKEYQKSPIATMKTILERIQYRMKHFIPRKFANMTAQREYASRAAIDLGLPKALPGQLEAMPDLTNAMFNNLSGTLVNSTELAGVNDLSKKFNAAAQAIIDALNWVASQIDNALNSIPGFEKPWHSATVSGEQDLEWMHPIRYFKQANELSDMANNPEMSDADRVKELHTIYNQIKGDKTNSVHDLAQVAEILEQIRDHLTNPNTGEPIVGPQIFSGPGESQLNAMAIERSYHANSSNGGQ